ncbi:MAG: hypothetical protein KAI94_08740, partial [Anaerolineales bacterium]|nr:hypothetical protein [Anaerolineales bacterium]
MALPVSHNRLIRIALITLFMGIFFGTGVHLVQSVSAEPELSLQAADSTYAISSSETITQTVYLPIVANNYPWISPFGAEATNRFSTGSTLLSRANELNISWTRMGRRISWRWLQPNPGDEINWDLLASFEEELRNLRAANITPVVIIYDSPHWAVIPEVRQDGQDTSCGPIAEDYFDEFADFVRQLVERYKTPEFNVHTWELGNEVDADPDLVP